MNWDAVGAIAEATGAIAVIVSILYLAAQVKQSRADVRTNVVYSLHKHEVELASMPATDSILACAIQKDHMGQKLSDEELAQYSMWMYSLLCNAQLVVLEYERLGIDDQTSKTQRMRLVGLMKPILARKIYLSFKDRFSPKMQAFVESTFGDQ
jgi:hypothetical protein